MHQPTFGASTMLLLIAGSVMVQEEAGRYWHRLTPDAKGDYVNGTWSTLSPMHHSREYFASAVLADGRVFVAGGEYSDAGGDLNAAEIYDPVWNLWTSLATPPGWTGIGNAPCCVLPDGRLLLGNIGSNLTAIYDPPANTWTAAAKKHDPSEEETWTLLPDETALTVECTEHPQTEKYIAAAGKWVSTGTPPSELCLVANGIDSECVQVEIGPWFLRIPIAEGLVNRLIGSLADGPLWVLGPNGPVPVPGPGDPWEEKVRTQAQAAHAEILRSIQTLQSLGAEVVAHREQEVTSGAAKAKKQAALPSGERRRAAKSSPKGKKK